MGGLTAHQLYLPDGLESLTLDGFSWETLALSNLNTLRTLSLSTMFLKALDLSHHPALENLNVKYLNLTHLDISAADATIRSIEIWNTPITTLNFGTLPNLEMGSFYRTSLNSETLGRLSALRFVSIL
jgi:hypothetical protein